MKKKVFITRSILSDGPELMRANGLEVAISPLTRPMTYEELKDKAHHFDALITMLSDQIDEAFLKENSHLKVISNYAVGFNNIDTKTASSLNISIGNTPDVLTEATAEVALGLMIAAARQFNYSHIQAAQGLFKSWEPTGYLGHGLAGKKCGIVGFGRIGSRLAEMAHYAFKMKIVYTSRFEKINHLSAERLSLDQLLSESDFISLHLPLSPETKKLIGKKEFGLMKKNAVLVNTSRGEIIDQDALIYALKNKLIFGAGLDVTDPEPLPLTSELFKLDNALILPHIGSATYEARRAMSLLASENIIAGLEGRPLKARVN
jgi:glyoxylate reductase